MDIPEHIFKSYDLRGIYPSEFNEENAVPITRAIYGFFQKTFPEKKHLTVVLGRDMRLSSPAIFEAVKKTLVELGAEVIIPGIVSTPTFYFTVFHYQYDVGIQITASHNPKDYNGLKFVINSGSGLIKIGKSTGMEEIKEMVLKGEFPENMAGGKVVELENVVKEEIENALSLVGNPKLNSFKVVADAANSVGGLYLEELYKQIPGELVKMNFDLDGTFPAHPADPLDPKNLVDIQKKVVEEKADLGLSPDGDGDRLFFIDERGEVVSPSKITAIVARELLREHKGEKILFDIRYMMTPKRITEESGGEAVLTKVGHAFITEKMNESGGIFAGESSAHFFFKATGNAEGPLLVVLHVLKAMTEQNKKLSELSAEVTRSRESGEINFKVKNAKEIMEKLKASHSDGEIMEIDGVAVQYPDWRFSLRMSNTEPLLRLNVEEEIDGYQGRHEQLIKMIEDEAEFDEVESDH